MIKKLILTTLLLAASALTSLAAPILSVSPSVTNVQVGNSFTLSVNIADVNDLFGWELNISFGPAELLNASTPTEGTFLGVGTSFDPGTVDNGAATITLIANALFGSIGVSGSGTLAQILFQAIAVGTATVSISNILLIDSNLDSIFPDPAVSATVNITPQSGGEIPEPSTFVLLSLGLAFGVFARRRA
jgi:hypothetical protein